MTVPQMLGVDTRNGETVATVGGVTVSSQLAEMVNPGDDLHFWQSVPGQFGAVLWKRDGRIIKLGVIVEAPLHFFIEDEL